MEHRGNSPTPSLASTQRAHRSHRTPPVAPASPTRSTRSALTTSLALDTLAVGPEVIAPQAGVFEGLKFVVLKEYFKPEDYEESIEGIKRHGGRIIDSKHPTKLDYLLIPTPSQDPSDDPVRRFRLVYAQDYPLLGDLQRVSTEWTRDCAYVGRLKPLPSAQEALGITYPVTDNELGRQRSQLARKDVDQVGQVLEAMHRFTWPPVAGRKAFYTWYNDHYKTDTGIKVINLVTTYRTMFENLCPPFKASAVAGRRVPHMRPRRKDTSVEVEGSLASKVDQITPQTPLPLPSPTLDHSLPDVPADVVPSVLESGSSSAESSSSSRVCTPTPQRHSSQPRDLSLLSSRSERPPEPSLTETENNEAVPEDFVDLVAPVKGKRKLSDPDVFVDPLKRRLPPERRMEIIGLLSDTSPGAVDGELETLRSVIKHVHETTSAAPCGSVELETMILTCLRTLSASAATVNDVTKKHKSAESDTITSTRPPGVPPTTLILSSHIFSGFDAMLQDGIADVLAFTRVLDESDELSIDALRTRPPILALLREEDSDLRAVFVEVDWGEIVCIDLEAYTSPEDEQEAHDYDLETMKRFLMTASASLSMPSPEFGSKIVGLCKSGNLASSCLLLLAYTYSLVLGRNEWAEQVGNMEVREGDLYEWGLVVADTLKN
ncbi:hypothetical protein BD324DRAFT_640185, partial [Kockovaella imperatae]